MKQNEMNSIQSETNQIRSKLVRNTSKINRNTSDFSETRPISITITRRASVALIPLVSLGSDRKRSLDLRWIRFNVRNPLNRTVIVREYAWRAQNFLNFSRPKADNKIGALFVNEKKRVKCLVGPCSWQKLQTWS
ncbi:hypothetical protein Hanom_Chr12g01141391 [Helianthus anomalus]